MDFEAVVVAATRPGLREASAAFGDSAGEIVRLAPAFVGLAWTSVSVYVFRQHDSHHTHDGVIAPRSTTSSTGMLPDILASYGGPPADLAELLATRAS